MTLETQEALATFGGGSVLPTSDEGPFFLNWTTLYVWDSGSGMYVPQTILFKDDLNPKPWRANLTANQDIILAAPGSVEAELELTESYDPDSVFDNSTFIAPTTGYYNVKSKVGIAATAGSPTDTLILFYLKKNGFQMPAEQVFQELGNVFVGRTFLISTDIELAEGDAIKAAVGVQIGGGSCTVTITQNDSWMAGSKIRSSTF